MLDQPSFWFVIALAALAMARAVAKPQGVCRRCLVWSAGIVGAALLAVMVAGIFSDPAAGLGLFLILVAITAATVTVAGLACIAATGRRIWDALRR